jgi:uncharacterized protein
MSCATRFGGCAAAHHSTPTPGWPDVNVLIYAFRQDTAHHAVCKRWLDSVVSGDAQFGVSPRVLSAVARITTNPWIFRQPAPIDEAFAYCNNLPSQPHYKIVRPGERHWSIFMRLCVETGTMGPPIADAWFAALAIERTRVGTKARQSTGRG